MMERDKSLEALHRVHKERVLRFTKLLDEIPDEGCIGELDTHQVTEADLQMLGQRITTVGAGLTDASVVRAHASGEMRFTTEQKIRAAVLYTSANLISEVYDGQTARSGIRGNGIILPDGETTSPLLVIAQSDINVLRRNGSLLHGWMARIINTTIGDPHQTK